MSIKPCPKDANNFALMDRWSEIWTRRFSGVDTDGQAIAPEIDCKEVLVHIEGSNVVAHISGTVDTDSDSDFYLTSDGTTIIVPVTAAKGTTVYTVKAPSGTINVSVMAGR